jgi:hypothetical protein
MAIKKTSWRLYKVPKAVFQANKVNLPEYDEANPSTWKNAFDSEFTKEQVINLTSFSYTISRENEEVVYWFGCDNDSQTLLDTEDLPNPSLFDGIKQSRNIYIKLFQKKLAAANCSRNDYSSFRRTLNKVKILSALMDAFVH